jgi:hypothetical protein
VAEIFLAVDVCEDFPEFPGVVPMVCLDASALRALAAEAATCFVSRTLVQRWVCAFLTLPEPDTSSVSLALEVICALDHPNTNGECPYVDPVYLDLARRFVEKVEGGGMTCDGLEAFKLRYGLVGREPVLASH